eukprot:3405077-Rhodomonas_salina.1
MPEALNPILPEKERSLDLEDRQHLETARAKAFEGLSEAEVLCRPRAMSGCSVEWCRVAVLDGVGLQCWVVSGCSVEWCRVAVLDGGDIVWVVVRDVRDG